MSVTSGKTPMQEGRPKLAPFNQKTKPKTSFSGPAEHNKARPYVSVTKDLSSSIGLLEKDGKQFSTRKAAESDAYNSGNTNPNIMTVGQLKKHNDKLKEKNKGKKKS